MEIRVHLTGQVLLEADGQVVLHERLLRGRQGRLAFAYLVCERERPVTREELARALWAEDLPPAWEMALSVLVSRPRSALAAAGLGMSGVAIPPGYGQYHLFLPASAWVDLEACAAGVDTAEGALRSGDISRVLGPAFVAATIARRPFLPGAEGEWVESQRRRLERWLLRALDCLTRMWLATGESALAIEGASEAVERDPFREPSYQLLMRAFAAAGHRAEGLRVYARLKAVLDEEIGAAPSAETEAIYRELL